MLLSQEFWSKGHADTVRLYVFITRIQFSIIELLQKHLCILGKEWVSYVYKILYKRGP